jgi:3-hydroxyacyl-CoA dehydrogenase
MSLVEIRREGDIGVILCNNPPINALSYAFRCEIAAGLQEFAQDPAIKAIVLGALGRTFVAGADITEFGKPPLAPSLIDLIMMEDASSKPIVAALHGSVLGGGLELALGAHYRIALESTKFGLPEVKLGLIPGAGGTQRLPRLCGAVEAAKIIVSGEPINGAKALALGVVDKIVKDNLLEEAVAYARSCTKIRRIRDEIVNIGTQDAFEAAAQELITKAKNLTAPNQCINSIRNVFSESFDAGCLKERAIFMALLADEQSLAQRYMFFAEREAAKVPDLDKDTPVQAVNSVAIIGAGTMGQGIAMSFSNVGIPVTLLETTQEALDRGMAAIVKNYQGQAAKGRMSQAACDKAIALYTPRIGLEHVAGVDLIIEAVFENMAIKKEIFLALDKYAKAGAILATNTSTLDIDVIAAVTSRPESVIGLHFFSPANIMKLLEIVRAKATSKTVLKSCLELAKKINKIPAVVGVCYGFVGNRILHARMAQSEKLILQGASPYQIDRVLRQFGFPMGPFQMGDLAGLDVGWRIRQGLGKKAAVFDELCEQGRFGQKTGRGFYIYDAVTRKPQEDPEVELLCVQIAKEKGITRRQIDDVEILERHIFPMINEGAKILAEGIAQRPSDIDIIWINGYAWPFWKGGPMYYADTIGLPLLCDKMRDYARLSGDDTLLPAPLLIEMAQKGQSFRSWKK